MRNEIFGDDFLRRLDLLGIRLKNQMEGGLTGARKSMSKGTSVEFSDFREYTPGDDFRRIDWNAYARFGKLYLKLFMEEKEAAFTILIDGSQSMAMDGKDETALKMAAALGYMAFKGQDRFRYLLFTGGQCIDSGLLNGRTGFMRGLDFLRKAEFSGKNDLENAKGFLKPMKGGSFILSDFLWEGGTQKLLGYLGYCKQETALFQVLSKAELEPIWDGGTRLIDSEDGKKLDLVLNPILLEKYKKELELFIDEIKDSALKYGATHVVIDAGEPFEKVFMNSLMGVRVI